MNNKFKAIVLNQSGDKFSREVKNLDTSFFKSGNVLVKVDYSGLNYKDERVAAREWLTKYKNPYVFSIFDETGRLGIDLGITAAPETFVIDAEGIIRMKHVGPIDPSIWQSKFLPLITQLEAE